MKNEVPPTSGGSFFIGITVGSMLGALAAFLFITPAGRRVTQHILDITEEIAAHGDEMLGIQKDESSVKEVQKKLAKKSVDRT